MTSIPLRWRIAALLFIGAVLNYLDRACLSAVSPAIKQHLGISDSQMGLVFSSFFAGYAVMNLVGGWTADRFGPKKVLAASLVAWSGFCAATAAATGYTSLLVTRGLFGAAEGPFGAASATALNRWFPKREISSALAAVASGTAAGAIVAGPLIALIYAALDWRGSLIAISCLGVAFALVWMRFAEDGDPHPATGDNGRDRAAEPATGPAPVTDRPVPGSAPDRMAVRRYLLHPTIVANALAYFAYTYLLAVYLSWLPLFFTTRFHLRIESAAVRSSLPWMMAFVGIWAGALLSDHLFRRTGRLAFSRRVIQVVALGVAGAGTVTLGLVESSTAATVIASLSLFALFVSGTSFWAVVQDVVASRAIGTVSGFTHFIANLGGIAGPAVTGFLVEHSGSFRSAWLAAGLTVLGAIACVVAASQLRIRDMGIGARAGG